MKDQCLDPKAICVQQCLISVVGCHAGEEFSHICSRKSQDISAVGRTFWLLRSPAVRPEIVQQFCNGESVPVFFIASSSSGGSQPAVTCEVASCFSVDRVNWTFFPTGVGPVLGKVSSGAFALVLGSLNVEKPGNSIDLWEYEDSVSFGQPIKFKLGHSSVCAIRRDTSTHPERMKNPVRRLLAKATLIDPYCVWVK